jgi:hypothetical protein
VSRATVNVWFNGAQVVSGGEAVDGRSSVTANGLSGFDIVIVPVEPLSADETCTVRVTADDTLSSSSVDGSWTFSTVEDLGPRVNHASTSPAPGSNPSTSPPTITIVVSDAVASDDDFVISSANAEYAPPAPIGPAPAPANQIWFSATGPNTGLSFRGAEGRRILISPGQWRTIVSVQGDTLATYDGAQATGTNVTATVYRRAGLDVVVDGVTVVLTGQPVDWGAVVTPVAGGMQVTVTPPTPWPDGSRVPVFVRAADGDGDVSELAYDFLVGQAQGPVVSNISPAQGTRGLPVGPGPTSDLAFRVTSASGVALASVNVLVDGVAAVTAGTGVGTYAASTLTPISGGYDVVLKNSVAYADGRIVHVDVSCADTVSRPGERRVWSVQFGEAAGSVSATQAGGEIPSDAVVRVCAYDLSASAFCRPAEMGHTGYAADGYWYEQGTRTQDVASWFTELGQFPAGGQLVVMSGHWALLPALASAPWAQCQQLVSGDWNMAGKSTSPLLDGDFSPRNARFALASALGVVVVDFAADRATLIDDSGRMTGAWGISQRAINQASGDIDGQVALDASACQRLALDGDVIVVCQAAALSVVRGDESRSQAYSTSWSRARVDEQVFAVAYNDLGQGAVEIWSLDGFFAGTGMSELYDDVSSPAIPAAEVNDIDIRGRALFAASDAEVTVIDRQNASAASYSQADLGLTGTGNVSAVSSMPGTEPGYGYFYAGSDGPGRVTRFRIHWPSEPSRAVTVSDGVPVSSLSAFGSVDDNGSRFLRLAMRVVGDLQAFVNSSMNVIAP